MLVKVQKWGSSLALRIPAQFVDEMGIREGTLVELSVSKDCLVATPAHLQTLRLKDLLAKVTKANIHPEVDLQ